MNEEDILYGSSNDCVEKVYVYSTVLHLLFAGLGYGGIKVFRYIPNKDTIQPTALLRVPFSYSIYELFQTSMCTLHPVCTVI